MNDQSIYREPAPLMECDECKKLEYQVSCLNQDLKFERSMNAGLSKDRNTKLKLTGIFLLIPILLGISFVLGGHSFRMAGSVSTATLAGMLFVWLFAKALS